MRWKTFIWINVLIFFALPVRATSERDSVPFAVGMEVLGRSIIYGPQFDMLFNSQWSVGAGVAQISSADISGLPATALIPLFTNFYFSSQGSSWFLTSGITMVTNSSEMKGQDAVLGNLRFSSFPLLPNLGVGYEIRQAHGFLFRLNSLLYWGKNLAPAQGFVLGWVF